jgi:choloylglycine hydrolase
MCTRILYQGSENLVITGRSMDWNEDIASNILILPRHVDYNSYMGKNPISWKSKYGSIVTFGYHMGSTDGMNEKGLVTNLLYLAESDYGNNSQAQDLCLLQWVQFTLDSFANVAEAVAFYQATPLNIVTGELPNGRKASMHLSLSDASGDSAILEYIDGQLSIHHSRDYIVMTNSPQYAEQLALCNYWKNINGMVFLPGSISAADRFVRVSFFLNAIPKTIDKHYITALADQSYQQQALASVLGVIRSAGVPLGIQDPNKPNISSTIWRTLSDHKNLVYYFDSATSPSIFWIDMKKIDFSKLNTVMSLQNVQNQIYVGDTLSQFVEYQMPTPALIKGLLK